MSHLLHLDSSIQGDRSASRALSARAAERWVVAHPRGTVTYRDFAADPPPHVDAFSGVARMTPPDEHTDEQAGAYAYSVGLVEDIKAADTVLLGLPLYNFGPPSSVKAWVDHIVLAGVSFNAVTNEGLLADTELIVLAARGGGYAPGTPREGWDHAEPWLPHALSLTGLVPRFITVELTLAGVVPAMAELEPLRDESRARAEAEIDGLWA